MCRSDSFSEGLQKTTQRNKYTQERKGEQRHAQETRNPSGGLQRTSRKQNLRSAATGSAALVALFLWPYSAHSQATSVPAAPSNPLVPTGVTRLPQDAPPLGPQGPLPAPALPLPRPDKPLDRSPALTALATRFSEKPLTLDQAVAIALATNRSLAFAGEALYRAQGRTSETRSAFNPTLGANVGDVYLASSLQPATNAVATLPLDISGLLRAAADQAQFQEVAARLDVNRARNQIVYDVKSGFYNVLRSEALVSVATENLQNSLDRLKDANLRYQVRAVAYFDVVRAQTDVANAQKQVIQARNGVSLATATLNNAIGIEITTPLQVSAQNVIEQPPGVAPPNVRPLTPQGTIPPSGTGNAAIPPAPEPEALKLSPADLTAPTPQSVIGDALKLGPEFQAVLHEAVTTRPEVLEGDANIAAARKGIQIARRSMLPGLSLSVGYFYLRNSTGNRHINEPEAQLALSLPLYDGGVARAREQQARGDVATAITNRRQAVDGVTLDVQQAYLNLVQARDQVAVANQVLAQAREAFQLARTRYNAGVSSRAGISPLLEVSDAQAALTLAESNQVNALYDYNQSRAQLDRSVGRFAYVQVGPGYNKVPPAKTVGR